MKYLLLILFMSVSCKQRLDFVSIPDGKPFTKIVDKIDNKIDNAIIKARATMTVTGDGTNTAMNMLKQALGLTTSYASSSTITVTYTSTPSVTFTLDTSSFGPISVDNNDILDMGSITVTALKDNGLKVCGVSGDEKCTTAFIRAYVTGEKTPGSGHNIDGFIHVDDEYGAPVYSDKASTPTQLVGTGASNSSMLQTYTIPGNKNKIRLTNFPTPVYNTISDFANAGAGDYSMVYVIEYGVSN